MKKNLKLLISTFFLSTNVQSSDIINSQNSYDQTIENLTTRLQSSKYSSNDFDQFLKSAHMQNPVVPLNYNLNGGFNPFVKDLMFYIANNVNIFMRNLSLHRATKEENARLLIGAVNVTLTEQFSEFLSDENEKRKKLMCFISSCLQNLSNRNSLSDDLKKELKLNEIIFGVHHLNELLRYKNYPNPDDKKKEWMTQYWNALESHSSRSNYLNTLGGILLMEGHDKVVDNPLRPFFTPSVSSHGLSSGKENTPNISTITYRTSRAKFFEQKLEAYFRGLNQTPERNVPPSLNVERPLSVPSLTETPDNMLMSSQQNLEILNSDTDVKQPNKNLVVLGKRKNYRDENITDSVLSPPKKIARRRIVDTNWDNRLNTYNLTQFFQNNINILSELSTEQILNNFRCKINQANRVRVIKSRSRFILEYKTSNTSSSSDDEPNMNISSDDELDLSISSDDEPGLSFSSDDELIMNISLGEEQKREKQDSKPSFTPKKPVKKKSSNWDKKLVSKTIQNLFKQAWQKNTDLTNDEVLTQMGCVLNAANRERVTKVKSYLVAFEESFFRWEYFL